MEEFLKSDAAFFQYYQNCLRRFCGIYTEFWLYSHCAILYYTTDENVAFSAKMIFCPHHPRTEKSIFAIFRPPYPFDKIDLPNDKEVVN